jgi:ATP-dependent helicase/nuclease subunit B
VRDVLAALAAAHAVHDDPPMDIAGMAAGVRRWIEEQTFVPDSDGTGVQFLDDQAARYGEFDEITIVGLIEGEWPERPKRNIFYPASLLASLGWPTEKDRRGAALARFLELLESPLGRVKVSTVSLDDEALVEASTFVDEIPRAKLPVMLEKGYGPFSDAEKGYGPFFEELDPDAREWISMRAARSSRDDDVFHGFVSPGTGLRTARGDPSPTWSVSALEAYLGCPFKFFAQYVVRLEDEPDDEEVMDPRTQGQFVHEVFEAFFRRWQHEGHQAITPATIETARILFREVVEECLGRLPGTEAALERTRLLGSPAAAGLGEAVFRMEAERLIPVVARLLEHRLAGEFAFETAAGPRRLSINGKADRIDLLADGTFRVIDYKLGWPPNRARALQLPIYALCAEQSLKGYLGRQWTFGEAAYLAFKGPKRVVGLFASVEERARVLTDAQQRLADTVDAINAGHFPPAPDDVHRCETCTYASVCRKDYVGDA